LIFSNDKDFQLGWHDALVGNKSIPSRVINVRMYLQGKQSCENLNATYNGSIDCEEYEDFLLDMNRCTE
jgi:hypothetical protein